MNETKILEDVNWSITVNAITKEMNGDNTSINVESLKGLLNLYQQEKRKNKIKYEYLKLIVELGFDYDGCDGSIKALKGLIDELVGIAVKAMENDDKSIMYNDIEGLTPKNILLEALDVKPKEFDKMCNEVRKEE